MTYGLSVTSWHGSQWAAAAAVDCWWCYALWVMKVGSGDDWICCCSEKTSPCSCWHRAVYTVHLQWAAVCCKPEGPLFSAEFVCLSVCLWPALLPFIIDRFWWNLVTRTLLWFSVAATIMVQIGRRGTTRCLFENLKKFSKLTELEFQNSAPSFFVSMSPVYCKKNSTRFEQNWWRR